MVSLSQDLKALKMWRSVRESAVPPPWEGGAEQLAPERLGLGLSTMPNGPSEVHELREVGRNPPPLSGLLGCLGVHVPPGNLDPLPLEVDGGPAGVGGTHLEELAELLLRSGRPPPILLAEVLVRSCVVDLEGIRGQAVGLGAVRPLGREGLWRLGGKLPGPVMLVCEGKADWHVPPAAHGAVAQLVANGAMDSETTKKPMVRPC